MRKTLLAATALAALAASESGAHAQGAYSYPCAGLATDAANLQSALDRYTDVTVTGKTCLLDTTVYMRKAGLTLQGAVDGNGVPVTTMRGVFPNNYYPISMGDGITSQGHPAMTLQNLIVDGAQPTGKGMTDPGTLTMGGGVYVEPNASGTSAADAGSMTNVIVDNTTDGVNTRASFFNYKYLGIHHSWHGGFAAQGNKGPIHDILFDHGDLTDIAYANKTGKTWDAVFLGKYSGDNSKGPIKITNTRIDGLDILVGNGLASWPNQNIVIDDNTVTNADAVDHPGSINRCIRWTEYSTNMEASGNQCTNDDLGFYVDGGANGVTISGNTIVNNMFSNQPAIQATPYKTSPTNPTEPASTNLVITGNVATSYGQPANGNANATVWLQGITNSTVSGNTLTNHNPNGRTVYCTGSGTTCQPS